MDEVRYNQDVKPGVAGWSRAFVICAVVLGLACPNGPAEAASHRRRSGKAKAALAAPPRDATLAERLAWIARRAPVRDRSQVAVAIAPVGQPPILSLNADAGLVLASTTKLFRSSTRF